MGKRGSGAAAAEGEPVARAPTGRWQHRLLVVGAIASVLALEAALAWGRFEAGPTTDETFTVLTVRNAPASLARGIRSDPGMASYYTTLSIWARLVGHGLRELRYLSFLAFTATVVGICLAANSEQCLLYGWLASLAFALSPATREAAIDARAAAFSAAISVLLVIVLRSVERRVTTATVFAAAATLTTLGYSHPSALIPGLAGGAVLMWLVRAAAPPLRTVAFMAASVQLPALAMAGLKSHAAAAVARPGWSGVHHVLSSYLGGQAAIAAFTLAACVVVAATPRSRGPVIRSMAGSGAACFFLGLLALPVATVFIPRYFVVSAAMVATGLALLPSSGWRGVIRAGAIFACVAGGLLVLPQATREDSQWCDMVEALDAAFQPGDTVAFTAGLHRAPVVVCLGDRAPGFFRRGTIVPETTAADLSDPRSLWNQYAGDGSDRAEEQQGGRRLVVWASDTTTAAHHGLERLRHFGATCATVRRETSGLGFAVCEGLAGGKARDR